MQYGNLQLIARLSGLSMSDVAKKAGISRQAVSLWGKHKAPSIRSRNLIMLCKNLGVGPDDLLAPLPLLGEDQKLQKRDLEAMLLWDLLYKNLEDFVVALVKGNHSAIARLVQTQGLFKSASMLGRGVWKKFEKYKKYIHPVRRKELEILWQTQKNLGLI
ncbi:MAG: hypothetical protein A2583_07155 [Bdellovibrionales bacterium RIFOXYD1_FULL_53_11]|nr:MAG: hypothetical protein A2583_07155 [Bdellovibrionales bacterium RIFOXYD1_FULL_53_11]